MPTDIERLTLSLEANTKNFENKLAKQNQLAGRIFKELETRASTMERSVSASFSGLASAVSTAVVVREVQKLADAWLEAGNKIKAAGVGEAIASSVQNEIADIAGRARASFGDVADLYARLTRSGQQFGATQAEIAVATETVAKALKVSGASASETQSTLVQLGQALGSGRLQGDELRSLLENAPVVAQAIAKEFGVAVGSLKELGAEGKLVSDRVFKAIVNAAPDVSAAFAKTQATIADSFRAIEVAAVKYVGNSQQVTIGSRALSAALQGVASNFETVATGAVALGTVLASRLVAAGLAPLLASIGAVVAGSATATASIAGMGATATVASRGVLALRAGLSLLGGPLGAAIFGTAAVVTYLATETGKGKDASDRYGEALAALRPPAESAKTAIKDVGDQVAATSQRMNEAAQDGYRQKLQGDAKEAANLTTTIRGAVAGLEQYGAVGLKADDKKRGLDLVREGMEGDEKAAIAAADALRRLGETNISFANAFASIATMLQQLAAVRAAASTTRAALAGVQAGQAAEGVAKARRDEQRALEASGFRPDTALPNVNSDPVVAALRLQSKVREAEMDESAKRLKDKTQQLYDAALGDGGGVTLAQAEAAAKKILAAEDAAKGGGGGGGGGGGAEDRATSLERYIINLQRAGELAKAELATAGLGNVEREKSRALVEATAAAQKDHAAGLRETVELTAAERERILGLAEATAQWKDEAKRAKEAMDFAGDLAKDAFKGIISDLQQGKSAAEAFTGALQKMASKVADKAFDSLFDGLFKSGGGGGIFASLFKGPAAVLSSGTGGLYASGGYTGPGGKNTPAGVVHKGEYVFSKSAVDRIGLDQLERMHKGYSSGGLVGGAAPAIMAQPRIPSFNEGKSGRQSQNFSVSIDVRGATGNQEIQSMVQMGIARGIQAYDKKLDRALLGKLAVADARYG